MANRETSDRLSRKAAKVMASPDPFHNNRLGILFDAAQGPNGDIAFRQAVHDLFDDWVINARSLAGSVLSQDETKGKRQPVAGTSAYEMVAAVEQQHVEVTETLIHMVAATVLSIVLGNGVGAPFSTGKDEWSVAFSPADMDRMHREYEMSAKRDGLITEITIQPRAAGPLPPREAHLEDRPESLMTQDEPETPFEPQAPEHVYDRPLWAARKNGALWPTSDRQEAEKIVQRYGGGQNIVQVENRFCYHNDCPAEHCNHLGTSEVTSGVDTPSA